MVKTEYRQRFNICIIEVSKEEKHWNTINIYFTKIKNINTEKAHQILEKAHPEQSTLSLIQVKLLDFKDKEKSSTSPSKELNR